MQGFLLPFVIICLVTRIAVFSPEISEDMPLLTQKSAFDKFLKYLI